MKEEIGDMIGKAERISRFKQQVIEELRAQRVYIAMASSLPVVASSSHIGRDEEGKDSSTSTEPGGMVNAPASQ